MVKHFMILQAVTDPKLILLYATVAGRFDKSRLACYTAASLARSALLDRPSRLGVSGLRQDARSRCYYVLAFLCRMLCQSELSASEAWMDIAPVPTSPAVSSPVLKQQPQVQHTPNTNASKPDLNQHLLRMTEILSSLMSYIRTCRCGEVCCTPWQADSEYTKTTSLLMDLSHKLPCADGVESLEFLKATADMVEEDREHWYPRIMGRIAYHTCFCILNHPMLLTLRFIGTQGAPTEFKENACYAVSRNAAKIINYLKLTNSGDSGLSDILTIYCIGVVATVYLHRGLGRDVDDPERTKLCFEKCLELLDKIRKKWDYASRVVSYQLIFSLSPLTVSSVGLIAPRIGEILARVANIGVRGG